MMLLALECSTDRRSVAVARNATVLAEASHTGGRETPLARLVGEALARAGAGPGDIALLALGLGPGSYTGIRAAIAFLQGWDLARPVRLLGRSSVDACARRAWRDGMRGPITVAVDAQRGEAYLAGYDLDDAGAVPAAALRLAGRAELEELADAGPRFVGPDLGALGLKGTPVWPDATALAELAAAGRDFLAADRLEPIYLRAAAFVKAPPPRHPV
jgi:tRNA threonylcarbamoyl adenosine modification protein YeaZ